MPDAPHLITMSCIAEHGVVSLSFFLFLLLSPTFSTAQPNTGQQPNDGYPYARFSPTMAIIIVVLVAALFFMGLFSIYIRNCSESNGSAVRPVAGGTGRSRRGTRGLEASVIETFPTMVYSEVKDHKIGKGALECAVCLNEFEDDETLRLIPKCDHVFHPDCIDAWLASHTTCPVCRANLAPQPDDPVSQPTELDSATTTEVDIEAPSTAGESETEEGRRNANCDVEAQVPPPEVEVISLNRTLNRNRTRGSRSSRTRRLFFPRSHSTGHSFVQQGENTDRFTLRLPADVRKQLMKRELNRTMSMVVLPRERSSRRGFRGGDDGGSNRGGRSFKRLEKLDQGAKSDRWVFTMAPPFFSRASSMKSPRVAADDGEGTSSRPVGPAGESSRPPV